MEEQNKQPKFVKIGNKWIAVTDDGRVSPLSGVTQPDNYPGFYRLYRPNQGAIPHSFLAKDGNTYSYLNDKDQYFGGEYLYHDKNGIGGSDDNGWYLGKVLPEVTISTPFVNGTEFAKNPYPEEEPMANILYGQGVVPVPEHWAEELGKVNIEAPFAWPTQKLEWDNGEQKVVPYAPIIKDSRLQHAFENPESIPWGDPTDPFWSIPGVLDLTGGYMPDGNGNIVSTGDSSLFNMSNILDPDATENMRKRTELLHGMVGDVSTDNAYQLPFVNLTEAEESRYHDMVTPKYEVVPQREYDQKVAEYIKDTESHRLTGMPEALNAEYQDWFKTHIGDHDINIKYPVREAATINPSVLAQYQNEQAIKAQQKANASMFELMAGIPLSFTPIGPYYWGALSAYNMGDMLFNSNRKFNWPEFMADIPFVGEGFSAGSKFLTGLRRGLTRGTENYLLHEATPLLFDRATTSQLAASKAVSSAAEQTAERLPGRFITPRGVALTGSGLFFGADAFGQAMNTPGGQDFFSRYWPALVAGTSAFILPRMLGVRGTGYNLFPYYRGPVTEDILKSIEKQSSGVVESLDKSLEEATAKSGNAPVQAAAPENTSLGFWQRLSLGINRFGKPNENTSGFLRWEHYPTTDLSEKAINAVRQELSVLDSTDKAAVKKFMNKYAPGTRMKFEDFKGRIGEIQEAIINGKVTGLSTINKEIYENLTKAYGESSSELFGTDISLLKKGPIARRNTGRVIGWLGTAALPYTIWGYGGRPSVPERPIIDCGQGLSQEDCQKLQLKSDIDYYTQIGDTTKLAAAQKALDAYSIKTPNETNTNGNSANQDTIVTNILDHLQYLKQPNDTTFTNE